MQKKRFVTFLGQDFGVVIKNDENGKSYKDECNDGNSVSVTIVGCSLTLLLCKVSVNILESWVISRWGFLVRFLGGKVI